MEHLEVVLTSDERSLLFLCLGLAAGHSAFSRSTVADVIDLATKLSLAFNEAEARWGFPAAPPPVEN